MVDNYLQQTSFSWKTNLYIPYMDSSLSKSHRHEETAISRLRIRHTRQNPLAPSIYSASSYMPSGHDGRCTTDFIWTDSPGPSLINNVEIGSQYYRLIEHIASKQ